MPMYDYECEVCGHVENDMLYSAIKPLPCPKCKRDMRRKFPLNNHFQVKGEGWRKDGHAINKDEDVVKHD